MKLPFFLASRFVAAETLEETLPTVRDLNRKGLRVALDRLGEDVEDRRLARSSKDAYVQIIRTIAREHGGRELDVDLSIKLSDIGQTIDRSLCRNFLTDILTAARGNDVFVTLDMEGSNRTESTLSLFYEAHDAFPETVGAVLQAYLKRTAADIEKMCARNARVRLCKGAYDEPPEIAYQDMEVIRNRYIEYMKRLLLDAKYPGIATHDDMLIEAAKRFTDRRGIPKDAFEFQMLYGMRPGTQQHLVQEGYNCLVYVPFGTEWLPYFTRRLRERKENVWFVVKHLFRA